MLIVCVFGLALRITSTHSEGCHNEMLFVGPNGSRMNAPASLLKINPAKIISGVRSLVLTSPPCPVKVTTSNGTGATPLAQLVFTLQKVLVGSKAGMCSARPTQPTRPKMVKSIFLLS